MIVRSLALLSLALLSLSAAAETLRIERLTWAGAKISNERATVFVDAVGTDLWNGEAPQGLVPVTADTRLRFALLTHLHNDHFDAATLSEVLGERGSVICAESAATYVASRGLRVIPARLWEPQMRGGFVFTALPAADGFGDEQVSWLIQHQQTRILHAGDSLWHGQWGLIGAQFGPIDVAFLPINGAMVATRPSTRSSAVMTPQQAVDAARLLGVRSAVPIHFGLNSPPNYVEVDNPLQTFLDLAAEQELTVQPLRPGELWQAPQTPEAGS